MKKNLQLLSFTKRQRIVECMKSLTLGTAGSFSREKKEYKILIYDRNEMETNSKQKLIY